MSSEPSLMEWWYGIEPGQYIRSMEAISPTASGYPGFKSNLPGDAKDWEAQNWTDAFKYAPIWPLSQFERARLALKHEPEASASPDGYRLATCVVCERPMVSMWHLWLDDGGLKKEIHMCHVCATDKYGAPTPDGFDRHILSLDHDAAYGML